MVEFVPSYRGTSCGRFSFSKPNRNDRRFNLIEYKAGDICRFMHYNSEIGGCVYCWCLYTKILEHYRPVRKQQRTCKFVKLAAAWSRCRKLYRWQSTWHALCRHYKLGHIRQWPVHHGINCIHFYPGVSRSPLIVMYDPALVPPCTLWDGDISR